MSRRQRMKYYTELELSFSSNLSLQSWSTIPAPSESPSTFMTVWNLNTKISIKQQSIKISLSFFLQKSHVCIAPKDNLGARSHLSRSQSTAKTMVTSPAGRPSVSSTMIKVTMEPPGIPADPMLAPVQKTLLSGLCKGNKRLHLYLPTAAMETAMYCPKFSCCPFSWEMNMAATACHSAVPSMLTVAPIGRTNLDIRGSTLRARRLIRQCRNVRV